MPDPRQYQLQPEGRAHGGHSRGRLSRFMGTDIDALAIGNCFLRKEDQDPRLTLDYRDRFTPD